MVRVLAAGHVNWDVTLEVDRLPGADEEAAIHEQRSGGGGSAANVAAGLSGLEVSSGLVGCVGDDEAGQHVRRELSDRGVDLSGLAVVEGNTSTKYLLVSADGSVAVLGNTGVNEALEPGDVDDALVRDAEHLHLTNHRPATAAHLARVAVESGTTVSFDPGRRAGERDFAAVLDAADVVFVTEREATALFDGSVREAAASDLLVAVTHGGGGAEVYADETYGHPGFAVDAVDTSGCGDAFAAGFLSVWLDDGAIERALAVGNACGALACRRRGARSTLDWDAVSALLDDQ